MQANPKIIDLEQALKAEKVSVNEVCRRAGVDRSVWHRAKNRQGQLRAKTAEKLRTAITDLTGGKVDPAEAIEGVTDQSRDAAAD